LGHELKQLAILFKINGDDESGFNRVLIRARGATLKRSNNEIEQN
jgi:hypothetical protein